MEVYVILGSEWGTIHGVFESFDSLKEYFLNKLNINEYHPEYNYYNSLLYKDFKNIMRKKFADHLICREFTQ